MLSGVCMCMAILGFVRKIKEKLNVCCVYRGKSVCCGKKFARHICIVECMPGNGV